MELAWLFRVEGDAGSIVRLLHCSMVKRQKTPSPFFNNIAMEQSSNEVAQPSSDEGIEQFSNRTVFGRLLSRLLQRPARYIPEVPFLTYPADAPGLLPLRRRHP
jgi:hypothetical protein